MCDGHREDVPCAPRRNSYPGDLSRRTFLATGAAAAAGLALGSVGRAGTRLPAAQATGRAAVRDRAGQQSWRSAMHVHASQSEMTGSVASQVVQAARNSFDVLHLTEHDGRAYKVRFRTSYGFTRDELQYGGAWNVAPTGDLGRPVDPVDGLVSEPVSPHYAADQPQGSLGIALSAPPRGTASRCYTLVNGFTTGPTGTRANWNGSVVGDTWSVDVLVLGGGPDAWADVHLTLSDRPATRGRPGGVRALHYRLRTDIVSRAWQAHGVVGVVDVPVQLGVWTTVQLDPVGDADHVWPQDDGRDAAMNGTQFWATARDGARAAVYFSDLRRTPQGGYDPVGLQRNLVDGLAARAGHLQTYTGLEYSVDDSVHVNGLGGTPGLFDYDSLPNSSDRPLYPDYGPGLTAALVSYIHDGGGLASLNHLFGFAHHDTRSERVQSTATRRLITGLLSQGAGGADLVEVGYRQRNGYGLDHQLQVFDALIRNGVWVTGTGTSDDHTGVDWAHQTNNAYTTTWAASSGLGDQLAALAAGRAFVGFLDGFQGTLDLHLDAGPMGSVAVGGTSPTGRLGIDVTGLPDGGAVEVVQIDVDYAGAADPTAGSRLVRRLGASELQTPGIDVETSHAVAYRVNVLDGDGRPVAFSQPCWSLPERPPAPVPAGRAAPGTPTG